jgi:hypothetical protein
VESGIDPTVELDGYLPDGVVADKRIVERMSPAAQHSQEALDEDDGFLGSAAPEVWEYEVVNARKSEFEEAASHSEVVLEVEVVDESEITGHDVTTNPLAGEEPPPGSSTERQRMKR